VNAGIQKAGPTQPTQAHDTVYTTGQLVRSTPFQTSDSKGEGKFPPDKLSGSEVWSLPRRRRFT